MARLRRLALAAVLTLSLLAGPVSAHGVTTFAPPIPTDLLLVGAAGTVALTAGVLTRLETTPTPTRSTLVAVSAETATAGRWVARLTFLTGFLVAIYAGLTGPQQPVQFATVFVWPVWFKGVLVVSALVGSPWRTLSPWETLYDLLALLEGDDPAVRSYPDGLGTWPAAVGFLLLVGIVENLTVVPTRPRLTAVLVAAYAVCMLAGAVVFGREWFAQADPLGAFYDLVGRVAPLRVQERDDGSLALVRASPWHACSRPLPDEGAAALAVAAVYTVSFDGLVETAVFQSLLFDVRDAGVGAYAGIALYVAGFVAFLVTFWLVVGLAARLGGDAPTRASLGFGATLLPIAVGYDVAHNYPYVVRNLFELAELSLGQALVADPLAALSPEMYWTSEVGLVVLGHVAAVLAAHAVATRLFGRGRPAARGHAPLVVLMVGYTVLSLWVLSRPVGG
ncbi:hypothetical protein [Haloarchaeobius sp. DFWS5]|uniref:hypothetical protein n=1 Tax=Haloarchaeobius sp. DFWS5 TaxID=3446114 RepID=UPI003EBE4687